MNLSDLAQVFPASERVTAELAREQVVAALQRHPRLSDPRVFGTHIVGVDMILGEWPDASPDWLYVGLANVAWANMAGFIGSKVTIWVSALIEIPVQVAVDVSVPGLITVGGHILAALRAPDAELLPLPDIPGAPEIADLMMPSAASFRWAGDNAKTGGRRYRQDIAVTYSIKETPYTARPLNLPG